MTNDYTLPAGYYTLPVNATIVVPMSDTQQKINLTAPRLVYNDVNNADEDKYNNEVLLFSVGKIVYSEISGCVIFACFFWRNE